MSFKQNYCTINILYFLIFLLLWLAGCSAGSNTTTQYYVPGKITFSPQNLNIDIGSRTTISVNYIPSSQSSDDTIYIPLTFAVTNPAIGYLSPESCTLTSSAGSCSIDFIAMQAGSAEITIDTSPFQYESPAVSVK